MSEITPQAVYSVLDAIVGQTSANGDTTMDNESIGNIKKLNSVCIWVADRVFPAYNGNYPKQCASAEKVACLERKGAQPILDYMDIDLVELRSLVNEMRAAAKQYEDVFEEGTALLLEGYATRLCNALPEEE